MRFWYLIVVLFSIVAFANGERKKNNPCKLPINHGDGLFNFVRYGFDKVSKKCKKFLFRGQNGNKNNFRTLESCQAACVRSEGNGKSICGLTMDQGTGLARLKRYFYDDKFSMCTPFTYFGKNGNDNRFRDLKSCQAACICNLDKDDGSENNPLFSYNKAAVTKGTTKKPRFYYHEFPGSGNRNRFYYNKEEKKCKKFTYKGKFRNGYPLSGNSNNFETRSDCKNACVKGISNGKGNSKGKRNSKGKGKSNGKRNKFWYCNKRDETCEQLHKNAAKGRGKRYSTLKKCGDACLKKND